MENLMIRNLMIRIADLLEKLATEVNEMSIEIERLARISKQHEAYIQGLRPRVSQNDSDRN